MTRRNDDQLSLGGGLSRRKVGGRIALTTRVPLDLVGKPRPGGGLYGQNIKTAMGTGDPAQARHDRPRAIAKLGAEFAKARGEIGRLDAEQVWRALDTWRRVRVEAMADGDNPAAMMADGLTDEAFAAANDLFGRRPDLSTTDLTDCPVNVTALIARLERAQNEPEGWRSVRGFDAKMDKAAKIGGLAKAVPEHHRPHLRQRFAAAWVEVLTHVEIARRRAAVVLAIQAVQHMGPAAVMVPSAPTPYRPRADDITLGELIDLYRAEVTKARGPEVVGRKYNHLFTGLLEVLGPETWVRAITWKQVADLRDLLLRLPPNPRKKFGAKITLTEAADRADQHDRLEEDEDNFMERVAPATVSSYLSRLSAMMKWAMNKGYADTNPAAGMGAGAAPKIERRAFTTAERTKIFASLSPYRESGSWRWWVSVIAAYTGARASEIVQLNREDLRDFEGTPYFAVTAFRADGRRPKSKKEKTASARRNIALHPDLVAAGLLDFIESAAPGPLFPDVPRHPDRAVSHAVSKWFADYLDSLGMPEPALCFHSFRHGFKAAADAADVHPEYRRALLGHVAGDAGERYGGAHAVPVLTREISKISLPLETA